ncbi:MAG: DUF6364 family protein [Halothiobacillaceae bacterium]
MPAETAKLTIRLPREDLDFAKSYAKAHGVTLTEVIDRYLCLLRAREHRPSAEIARMTGLLPPEIDGEAEYHQHLAEKHSP